MADLTIQAVEQSENSRLDMRVAVCGFLFTAGLFLDGWAHFHGRVDESFFTPWHAVLYSSFAVTAAVVLVPTVQRYLKERDWRTAVPPHYGFALLGIVVFTVGGLGDMVWHTLFGIEEDLEALISPTHLLLGVGGTLVGSAPLRAAWFRPKSTLARQEAWPVILVTTSMLSSFTFFLLYQNPYMQITADAILRRDAGLSAYAAQQVGLGSILITTAITMGILMFILNRWEWRLPMGSLTLILTVNALGMTVLSDQYLLVWAALFSGFAGDLLLARLRPGDQLKVGNVGAVRLFAFLLPVILFLSYFGTVMQIATRFEWSIHMWLGSTFLAGVTGFLLSLLVVPPIVPRA